MEEQKQSPANPESQPEQKRPLSLSDAVERKRQFERAHELMATARRDAVAYLDAIERVLDTFMSLRAQKPNLDRLLDQATRRFYRSGLSVTSSYRAYCEAFIVTTEPEKHPELRAVPPEKVP